MDKEILSADRIERIYRLTDGLLLNRDWVVVPLKGSEDGIAMVLPDGKLLIRPPSGPGFDSWLMGLKERLEILDLDRALRASQLERHYVRTPAAAPPGSGSRKYVPWSK
ncbi:MAG TPA: hypothetical protein VF950_05560 [Planctomycetota bacterium]